MLYSKKKCFTHCGDHSVISILLNHVVQLKLLYVNISILGTVLKVLKDIGISYILGRITGSHNWNWFNLSYSSSHVRSYHIYTSTAIWKLLFKHLYLNNLNFLSVLFSLIGNTHYQQKEIQQKSLAENSYPSLSKDCKPHDKSASYISLMNRCQYEVLD